MKKIKLALGCGWRNYGKKWTHIDLGDYDHLDYKQDIKDLSNFKNDTVETIYASHVFEYFDRYEAEDFLDECYRVLKKGGKLYLSVPNFEAIAYLYVQKKIPLFKFLGPLYGHMDMDCKEIQHSTCYDFASLGQLLQRADFKRIETYGTEDLIGDVDDHSKAEIDGEYISLNVVCEK